MQELSGIRYFEIRFDKRGRCAGPSDVEVLVRRLGDVPATDVFLISHGWNNDNDEARALYRRFFGEIRTASAAANMDIRKFAVIGILWPSKKFADSDLIPGGAAGIGGFGEEALLLAELERLKGAFDAPDADARIEVAKGMVGKLDDAGVRAQFADLVRSLVKRSVRQDALLHDEDAADLFFQEDGDRLVEELRYAPDTSVAGAEGESDAAAVSMGIGFTSTPAEGQAAGFGSSLVAGARRVLNYTTYYQMKERAGLVGSVGVHDLLVALRRHYPERKLHLVGHSFGGRLVTAATAGRAGSAVQVDTMTLLQAAFSHHSFAQEYRQGRDGYFRGVVTQARVRGPILITHTHNDRAVGKAYPVASRLARQQGMAVGDANDLYGGIGANGAQKTPEARNDVVLAAGAEYRFEPAVIYNLRADRFIMDHSDVCGPAIAEAVLAAVKHAP